MVDTSMLDLFKMEVEQQTNLLSTSLLALEETPDSAEHLEAAMRGAHSIKGAAKLIGVDAVLKLAHVMENCLVAAQEGRLLFDAESIDVFLKSTDLIVNISEDDDIEQWGDLNQAMLDDIVSQLKHILVDKVNDESPSALSANASSVIFDQEKTNELIDLPMLELFRMECEQHGGTLNKVLLELEETPNSAEYLEQLMRAAHSIKGAGRLMGLPYIVELAHVMEDDFVAAQAGELNLSATDIDIMLKAGDVINGLSQCDDMLVYLEEQKQIISELVVQLSEIKKGPVAEAKIENIDAQDLNLMTKKESGGKPLIQELSMYELFRVECEQHGQVLGKGLLALEQNPSSAEHLEPLMRAAHSIKGAAGLVNVDRVVKLAHAMEDDFVAAQNGDIQLGEDQVDVLLESLDMVHELANSELDLDQWALKNQQRYDALLANLEGILVGKKPTIGHHRTKPKTIVKPEVTEEIKKLVEPQKDRVLRVSADLVNRLMGLAGESLVESRWLYPYSESLRRLKRKQTELVCSVDNLRDYMERGSVDEELRNMLRSVQKQASRCREIMSDRLAELESYDRRSSNLSSRLHREVVESRMRPFADGVHGFPRMVRDISRSLNKNIRLVIEGESTLVDRDILDKIEAPLNHLIRNAVDHGLETFEERSLTGKPTKGTIRLGAHHHAGMLSIVVEDDGRGVDQEKLRRKIVDKGLVSGDMSKTLSGTELMEFLFLPGFSTKDQVSEISGRGVGLDVVHDVVHEMRGSVKATSKRGKGTKFHLQLPLTLSVIPALIVDIATEAYAFPLARIDRIVRITSDRVKETEGNQFVTLDGKHVGLVGASQILERDVELKLGSHLSIVVLNERNNYYGMVVDKFLGERELVVQVMPEALGKVQDISAAALMEDGSPVLIVDVDDLICSIEKVLKITRLGKVSAINVVEKIRYKRVLVVDDSITVREVERKLLLSAGYIVETAVDGIDGLNVLRNHHFDLLVTDVDMPRMNGIELVKMVRQEDVLKALPVMIVSYKDREEDRAKGMEAGADYYLTKGSFHDETLLQAVIDLIGEAKV